MKADDFLLAFTTAPSREVADGLARGLVERGIAACVTVLPGASSTYRWQGVIEQADELQLLIKAPKARWSELEAAVRELHPYEVPELVAVELAAGSAAYLGWLADAAR